MKAHTAVVPNSWTFCSRNGVHKVGIDTSAQYTPYKEKLTLKNQIQSRQSVISDDETH